MKPKVRARDSSRRKLAASTSMSQDLMADQRMIEVDLDFKPQAAVVRAAVRRRRRRATTRTGFKTLMITALRIERHNAGLIDRGDESVRSCRP